MSRAELGVCVVEVDEITLDQCWKMTLWTFLLIRRPKIGSLLILFHEAHHDEQGVTLLGMSMVGKIGELSISATDDGSDEIYSGLRLIEVGEKCEFHYVFVPSGDSV